MDMNYLVQRKINAQKQYRRKVIVTIVLSVVLVLLIVVGLVKVILDDKKTEEAGKNGADNRVENVTPGATIGAQKPENTDNKEEIPAPTEAVAVTDRPTETPVPTPTPTPTPAKKKIAVDAGHGGDDLGSTRQGLYEKDANLAIALYLKSELETAGYEVFLVRDSDIRIDNEERPAAAIENKADLFVSVHLNSLEADSDATQGAETWYADLRNDGSDVLAQTVIDELTKVIDTRNRGIKLSNRLIVLKNPDMPPACLVECGFITSETERAKLFDPEYQQKIAKGICNGIKKFLPIEE